MQQVVAFVRESTGTLLGFGPDVFPVSARLGLRAKEGDPSVWADSRFDALEAYIRGTLDSPSRVHLKLLNPLGIGAALVERHLAVVGDRRALLQEDFTTLDQVERQLVVYQEDRLRDFEFRMADIDRILLDMEQRGQQYFDDTLRIGRVMDLLNRSRMQQGFEQQVVADAPRQIERKVNDLVDWLVDADLQQWQEVSRHLSERRRQHQGRIVGDQDGARFHYDRARLIESVGREAQRVVDSYDRRREASALADSARNAVATAAAAGAGALGLGAIVTFVATTAAADVTGVLMASVMAAIGFFVLPARRERAKEQMRRKVAVLRQRLSEALRSEFTHEIAASAPRIRERIAPYSRFVRAEGEKLRSTEQELREIGAAIEGLRGRVERQAA